MEGIRGIEFLVFLATSPTPQRKLIYEIEFETGLPMKMAYLLVTHCGLPPDRGYPDEKWLKEKANDGYWDYSYSIKRSKNMK